MTGVAPLRVTLRYRGLTHMRVVVLAAARALEDRADGVARLRAMVADPTHHPVLTIDVEGVTIRLDTKDVELVAVHSVHDVPAGGLFGGDRAQQRESLPEPRQPELHERSVVGRPLRQTADVDLRSLSQRGRDDVREHHAQRHGVVPARKGR